MATKQPESEKNLELDRNPSGGDEAREDFSTPDEKAENRKNSHQLALLSRNQGKLGSFLGTTDTSLKIAFVVILIAGLSFLISIVACIWAPALAELAKLSGTIMLTVAGYVFGVKSNKSE